MKILLDENIPVDLKLEFLNTKYDVYIVREFNWIRIKNEELLYKIFEARLKIDN